METIFFSKARAGLAGLIDKVNQDAVAVEIVRLNKPSAVLLGKNEYEGMMETIHLLSSPANAIRLVKAKAEIEDCAFEIKDLATVLGA